MNSSKTEERRLCEQIRLAGGMRMMNVDCVDVGRDLVLELNGSSLLRDWH
jgi:glutathione synthase/RimK-type ligase-like ATP-grasp enzyme